MAHDDNFPKVRFNGCLGGLRLTPEEIVFQDESGDVTLSWELDTLKDQVMKPVTSSVDLSFDMEGIMERVSFQMSSFAEIARFRSSIAKKRKILKSSQSSSSQQSSSDWCKTSPSSTFSLDRSISSAVTFHNAAEDNLGVSFHSEYNTTPPILEQPSKRRSVISPTNAMVRESSLVMAAKEPSIPLASHHTASKYTDSSDCEEEDSDDTTTEESNKKPSQQSSGDMDGSGTSHSTTAADKAIRDSPHAKRRATVEPNTLLMSRHRLSTVTVDSARARKENEKMRASNNTKEDYERRREQKIKENAVPSNTACATAITTKDLDEFEKRREQKIKENAVPKVASVAASSAERRRDEKMRDSSTSSRNGMRRTSTLELHEDYRERRREQKMNENAVPKAAAVAERRDDKMRDSSSSSRNGMRRTSTLELHEDYRERRREQKLRDSSNNNNYAKKDSDVTTADSSSERDGDDNPHNGCNRGDMDRSSSATVDVPSARRSATSPAEENVATNKKRISFAPNEDPLLALKRSRASTEQEVLTIKESLRGGKMERVTIQTASCKTSMATMETGGSMISEAGALRVNGISRTQSQQSHKSEKSGELSLDDPTETTLPESSAVGRNSPPTMMQDTLVEATLVEEGASGFFTQQIRDSVIASPVDVVNEDSRRRKLHMFAGFVCCCSIIIVIIALVVSFTVGGKGDVVVMIGEDEGMSSEEMFALFEERLQDMVYDASSLEDADSPQSKALHWLAFEDLGARELITDEMDERLHQRFLLAVFYFTMTQEKKLMHCQPPETGETSTCIHPVLESYSSEGIYFDQRMSEPAFRWLSEVEECRWAGVKCTDGVHVSKLQLPGYELQSTLPIEIGYMANLEVLDLQHNQIHGELPAEWGELAATGGPVLKTIRLDRNEITGKIPEQWCKINTANLQDLVLSNNLLTGALPSCVGDFVSLENFSVMHNSLSGELPNSLSNLSNLQRLHLAGNNFRGAVPEEFCDTKEGMELFHASADCDGLSESNYVECSCCTTCCEADGDKESCDQRLAESMNGGSSFKSEYKASGFAPDRVP
ncbi:receptor-like protein kinase [Seminavis robusta]|uniref:Receptor-like protein kinase n=1 Tax=Seminavis robusta TaxID=568900 RepID=A0A9N8H7C9_9STRA|nr:receptor-like protein kinase [Seminavis robusta]|eukprot:Sro200_g084680.1 receptor-like protein kinase (1059) ;mRNA; f:34179-37440